MKNSDKVVLVIEDSESNIIRLFHDLLELRGYNVLLGV